jgi:hypothetical protein
MRCEMTQFSDYGHRGTPFQLRSSILHFGHVQHRAIGVTQGTSKAPRIRFRGQKAV